jgi:5-methylcytosine-specific restriction endonuclease McrA
VAHVIGCPAWNKGLHASEETRKKLSDAHKGHIHSEETRKRMSASQKRAQSRDGPRIITDETRHKMSEAAKCRKTSDETRRKLSIARTGNKNSLGFKHSEETRRKNSEAHQGPKSHLWRGGISFEPYCPRFNEMLKEEIRNKFGRKCFICGKPENMRGLSVHHINFDKMAGCYGKRWNLLPLCQSCHAKTGRARFHYFNLLNNYWILNQDTVLSKEIFQWQTMR